ncbi:hypothetical protein [Phaeobacter inhibens]|uniref:hypothetical protein n=1 Tax=Phaeobacter inhibens TaxID=221822 RepID=UPI0021A44F4B|nr:hypothetical protein [Phaeobacter inhibens]UWS07433.1 hypothetical protein K4K98_14505 [Phaeobacter inhibens]
MKLEVSNLRHRLSSVVDWVTFQKRLINVGARRGNPLFVGIGTTKLFLVVIAVIAIMPQYAEASWSWRFWSFLTSPSNEIGDTLAGIASALAFLWIIVTVMLQSKELREQREELKLTRKAHQQQVSILVKQASIYEIEQKDRAEERAKRQFDQMLKALAELLGNEREWGQSWVPASTRPHMIDLGVSVFDKLKEPQDADDAIKQAVSSSQLCRETLDGYITSQTSFSKSGKSDAYVACLAFLKEVMGLYYGLGPDQKLRFDFLGLAQLSENLQAILEMDIWSESDAA